MPITYSQVTIDTHGIDVCAEIATLGISLLKELGEDYNSDHVFNTVLKSMESGVAEVYCAFDGDVMAGSLAFYITPELWNHDKIIASEAYWFVYPKYRGAVGGGLLDFVEKNIKADKITFGLYHDGLVKYLERKGYKAVKTIAEKEIKHDPSL